MYVFITMPEMSNRFFFIQAQIRCSLLFIAKSFLIEMFLLIDMQIILQFILIEIIQVNTQLFSLII